MIKKKKRNIKVINNILCKMIKVKIACEFNYLRNTRRIPKKLSNRLPHKGKGTQESGG